MQKNRLGLILSIGAAACYGLYPSTAKLAYANGANQALVIITTTIMRTLALLLATRLEGWPLAEVFNLKSARESAWSGFLQAITVVGILASLLYIPGPVMITIVFTHTIMLLFLMAYKGEIQLTKLAVGSTLIALMGITLVVDVYSHFDQLNKGGLVLALIASVATAGRLYSYGHQMKNAASSVVGARTFAFTTLFSLLFALVQWPTMPVSMVGVVGVILSCLSLALGTLASFYAIGLLGSFRVSLTLKLEPIFTTMYAFLILGEILSLGQYIGIGLVISSLLAYQYFDGSTKPAAQVGSSDESFTDQ